MLLLIDRSGTHINFKHAYNEKSPYSLLIACNVSYITHWYLVFIDEPAYLSGN